MVNNEQYLIFTGVGQMYSILFVDDDPDLPDIARIYLEETGLFSSILLTLRRQHK
jgi:CheY-like chemotaxis protein